MLVTLSEVLPKAKKAGYAVPAFNSYNLEVSQAIIEASEIERSPVIIAVSETAIKYAGLKMIYEIVSLLDEGSRIPRVLHLDHGKNLETIKKALDGGFTSVMFDGSSLAYQENLTITQEVVRLARKYNASVEAELGMIGGQEDKTKSAKIIYTDPTLAVDFVAQSGIDALAVALGTSHGLLVKDEHINYDLLEKISSQIAIPLVLHGASNLHYRIVKRAVAGGIAKINIDTELRQAFSAAVREKLKDKKLYDPRLFLAEGRLAVQKTAQNIIKRFGAENKA